MEGSPLAGTKSTALKDSRVLGCAVLPSWVAMGRRWDEVPLSIPDLPPLLPEQLPKFAL